MHVTNVLNFGDRNAVTFGAEVNMLMTPKWTLSTPYSRIYAHDRVMTGIILANT